METIFESELQATARPSCKDLHERERQHWDGEFRNNPRFSYILGKVGE